MVNTVFTSVSSLEYSVLNEINDRNCRPPYMESQSLSSVSFSSEIVSWLSM